MCKFYWAILGGALLWASPTFAQNIDVCRADSLSGAPLDGVIIDRLSAVLNDPGSSNLQRTVRREPDPLAQPLAYNSVLHSSCAAYSQNIKTLIERSLMHAIYSTERCASRFRFSELASVRSVLRNLEIRCDPTIAGLAETAVRYGNQNAMEARALAITINSSRFSVANLAPRSTRIRDIKELSSLIFHEALHLVNTDNRLDHNDVLSSNRLGSEGQNCNESSLYNDRVYFIQGVCNGDIFNTEAACEQVCTRALTQVEQPADVHFGRSYAQGDAAHICNAVSQFRARLDTAIRGPEFELQTYYDRINRIGSELLARMPTAAPREVKQLRDRFYALSVDTYSVRSIIEYGRPGTMMHEDIATAWAYRGEGGQMRNLSQIPQVIRNIDSLIADIQQTCRVPTPRFSPFCAGPRAAFIAELNRQRVMLTNFPQDVADWYSDPAPADLNRE